MENSKLQDSHVTVFNTHLLDANKMLETIKEMLQDDAEFVEGKDGRAEDHYEDILTLISVTRHQMMMLVDHFSERFNQPGQ